MFDVETCVSFITNRSSKIMANAFNERLLKKGITRVQWLALYHLDGMELINQTDLAEKMDLKNSTITRLVDRMEREGLLRRQKDLVDRRITQLLLTDKGLKLRQALLPDGQEMSEIFAKGIPPEDIDTFKRVLSQMVSNVSSSSEKNN